MAQISCSFKLLNRYRKQGCSCFSPYGAAREGFLLGFLGSGGRSKVGAGGPKMDAQRNRMLGNSRGGEEQRGPEESF